jgi:membrane-associated phospholipid phosphatase
VDAVRIRAVARAASVTLGALAVTVAGSPAAAQTRELRWDPAIDLTVTLAGGGAWIASEILKPQLAPASCRWCDVDGFDASVRDALVWRSTSAADVTSGVLGFVVAPLSAVGTDALAASHDGVLRNVPVDALLVAEAAVLAADVNQLTKFLVGRERPFVHALAPDQKGLTSQPSDNDLSFFSGHTTETFALAAAAGTVATMRGYRWAPVTWIAGGAIAAATGYLRIAADKHWLTDVAVGIIVGAGIGFAVPYFFHGPTAASASSTSPLVASQPPGGTAVTFAW